MNYWGWWTDQRRCLCLYIHPMLTNRFKLWGLGRGSIQGTMTFDQRCLLNFQGFLQLCLVPGFPRRADGKSEADMGLKISESLLWPMRSGCIGGWAKAKRVVCVAVTSLSPCFTTTRLRSYLWVEDIGWGWKALHGNARHLVSCLWSGTLFQQLKVFFHRILQLTSVEYESCWGLHVKVTNAVLRQ